MSWIKTIGFDEAEGYLRKLYKRVKGPENNVDNVLKIHSLRPHTLLGHMTLYKSVLHNSSNSLEKWYLEAIGVLVSQLNECDYCVKHHMAGFRRLLGDDEIADRFLDKVKKGGTIDLFDSQKGEGFKYAKALTLNHSSIKENDINRLRNVGFSDGEILEVNQVASYFNYVNRMVIGLGVSTDGDILGLSPNDSANPDDWSHS